MYTYVYVYVYICYICMCIYIIIIYMYICVCLYVCVCNYISALMHIIMYGTWCSHPQTDTHRVSWRPTDAEFPVRHHHFSMWNFKIKTCQRHPHAMNGHRKIQIQCRQLPWPLRSSEYLPVRWGHLRFQVVHDAPNIHRAWGFKCIPASLRNQWDRVTSAANNHLLVNQCEL